MRKLKALPGCRRFECADQRSRRHILDVDSCDNSVDMCLFIHAIASKHVETVVMMTLQTGQ